MTDALIVPFDPQIFQDGLAFFTFKFFFCTMDPAAGDTQISGGIHHIAHDKAAVVDIGGKVFVCKDDQQLRCAVERVEIHAHDRGIHFGKFVAQFFVRYGDDDGRLLAHTCCSIGAGLDDGIQFSFFDQFRLVGAAAAARFQCG